MLPGKRRRGPPDRRPGAAVGARGAGCGRVLQGRVRSRGALPRGRHRPPRSRRLPAHDRRRVLLGGRRVPRAPQLRPRVAGRIDLPMLLVVDDPAGTVERALVAGATLIAPVTEAHRWRLGRIQDPFGHHWEIGKPLVPWPPINPAPR
ncbi:MAG: VOC family protein [Solirubrobacteraceae bacterium]